MKQLSSYFILAISCFSALCNTPLFAELEEGSAAIEAEENCSCKGKKITIKCSDDIERDCKSPNTRACAKNNNPRDEENKRCITYVAQDDCDRIGIFHDEENQSGAPHKYDIDDIRGIDCTDFIGSSLHPSGIDIGRGCCALQHEMFHLEDSRCFDKYSTSCLEEGAYDVSYGCESNLTNQYCANAKSSNSENKNEHLKLCANMCVKTMNTAAQVIEDSCYCAIEEAMNKMVWNPSPISTTGATSSPSEEPSPQHPIDFCYSECRKHFSPDDWPIECQDPALYPYIIEELKDELGKQDIIVDNGIDDLVDIIDTQCALKFPDPNVTVVPIKQKNATPTETPEDSIAPPADDEVPSSDIAPPADDNVAPSLDEDESTAPAF